MSAEALVDTPEADSQQASAQTGVSHPRGYKHLSVKQIAAIIRLTDEGHSQTVIASLVGCSQSTVSDTLIDFTDSREIARKRLEASALRLVETVAATKDSAVALKALGKLDVVREDQAQGGNQLLVMLGTMDQPLSPPALLGGLSPVRLEGDERRPTETLAITSVSHKLPSVNVEVVASKGQTARHNKKVNKRTRRA